MLYTPDNTKVGSKIKKHLSAMRVGNVRERLNPSNDNADDKMVKDGEFISLDRKVIKEAKKVASMV